VDRVDPSRDRVDPSRDRMDELSLHLVDRGGPSRVRGASDAEEQEDADAAPEEKACDEDFRRDESAIYA